MPRAIRGGSCVIKVCSCGRCFSRTLWERLRFVGMQGQLELRNCTRCRSTLALPVQWVSQDPADYEIV